MVNQLVEFNDFTEVEEIPDNLEWYFSDIIPQLVIAENLSLRYWNGTSWIVRELQRWNGSSWVPIPRSAVKIWSNNTWTQI